MSMSNEELRERISHCGDLCFANANFEQALDAYMAAGNNTKLLVLAMACLKKARYSIAVKARKAAGVPFTRDEIIQLADECHDEGFPAEAAKVYALALE